MYETGGRESVQVLLRGRESSFKMQEPAITPLPYLTTRNTNTMHNKALVSGAMAQRTEAGGNATMGMVGRNKPVQNHYTIGGSATHHTPATTDNHQPEGAGLGNTGCVVSSVGVGGYNALNSDANMGGGDDLTSLTWLHSLDMGGMVPHLATPPTPPASPQPNNPLASTQASHTHTTDRKRKTEAQEKLDRIDYSQDGSVKPPYSYAALIGMAMKENQNKMTLSAIYKWIKENFAFYKTADPSWQNSIRHNLSLNKCFLKVPRNKDEPGKGGFWRLDPEYAESLVDGVFKKRRPARPTLPPPSKSKKNRRLPTQNQQQVLTQPLGIKVVVQPAQAAFMPPPTNKPPPRPNLHFNPEGVEVEEELVWSTLLGEEVHDDSWPCRAQELVTDLGQTGDPSTYPTTITTNTSTQHHHQHHHHQNLHDHHLHPCDHQSPHHHQIVTITTSTNTPPTLPSLELSPASLGVEEDLFTSPEYSEASNDDAESLTSSLDINNSGNWNKGGYGELPSMNTFCSSLTQLTPLEPSAAPVLVQDAHACWGSDSGWDEAKTLSLLDANLDLDNLIDLDGL